MTLLHKIYYNNASDFLHDILSTYYKVNPYTLRNPTDLYIPNYRLQIIRNSFFPSAIQDWNFLDINFRQEASYSKFKNCLKTNPNSSSVPGYFLVGDRKLNILHTRLRRKCSSLNSDLFRVNITNLPHCLCGNLNENAAHYLLECTRFTQQRLNLFQKLHVLNFPVYNLGSTIIRKLRIT